MRNNCFFNRCEFDIYLREEFDKYIRYCICHNKFIYSGNDECIIPTIFKTTEINCIFFKEDDSM